LGFERKKKVDKKLTPPHISHIEMKKFDSPSSIKMERRIIDAIRNKHLRL